MESLTALKEMLNNSIVQKDIATLESGTRGAKSAAFRLRKFTVAFEKNAKKFRKESVETFKK